MSDQAMVVEDFVEYRKAAGFTQEQLATLLGMSLRAIQDIENGRAKLRLVHVMAFEMILVRQAVLTGKLNIVPSDVLKPALQLAVMWTKAQETAVAD